MWQDGVAGGWERPPIAREAGMKAKSKRPEHDSNPAAGTGATKEVVAKLAQLLWVKAGRPEGKDREFLIMAEAALMGTNEPIRHET